MRKQFQTEVDPNAVGFKLISGKQIQKRVKQLVDCIESNGKPVSLFWIANGALFFAADLLRANGIFNCSNTSITTINARRYSGIIANDLEHDADNIDPEFHKDRHIVLIDDVLDQGVTLSVLAALLRSKIGGDINFDILVLVKKVGCQHPDFNLNISGCGFEIHGNPWLFGYGMDFDNRFRTQPSIWMAKRSELPSGMKDPNYPINRVGVKIVVNGMFLDEWDSEE